MKLTTICSIALLSLSTLFVRGSDIHKRIYDAIDILEKRQGSLSPIPLEVLQHARGIAIGTITKAGLGIGGQGGEGIVLLHYVGATPATWSAPAAYSTSGGSLGAQIGFTTIRYIAILNTDQAVRQFSTSGKLAIDATATGTAGDDTGHAGESTGDLSRRAMVVYKSTGGLYGGATFGGTSVSVDNDVNQITYGEGTYVRDIFSGKVHAPRSADRLYEILNTGR